MTKYFKRLPFIFALAMLFVASCSKEEDAIPFNQKGGTIFQSQVVTVDLNKMDLSEEEYQGTIGGIAVTLTKSDNHQLVFLVPFDASIGVQDLVIPALDEATIHYDVAATALSETPEATMAPFLANLEASPLSSDNSAEAIECQVSFESFNNYYSNATDAQKTEMALIYKANKLLFDSIILGTYSGRPSDANANCFAGAVIGMGASVALILSPTGASQILGVGLFAASLVIAKKCGKPLYDEYVMTENIRINDIVSVKDRRVNSSIVFQNDIASSVTLNVFNRKLIESDSAKTQSTWVTFFSSFNLMNANISGVNSVISVLNQLPFVNFPSFAIVKLPSTSPNISKLVNAAVFKNFTFNISHPNLKLVSSSLESDGQLNLRIKIIGTPKTLPVETFLNYKYSDDFSSFSGKIPLIVEQNNPFIGNWKLLTFNNGYYPGEFYTMSYVCSKPYNAFTTSNATFVFTTNTFSNNQTVIEKAYNITYDGDCKLLTDEPDTEFTETLNPRGTYVVKEKTATLTYLTNDGAIIGSINMVLIDSNKFQLEGSVYVRQ